jgi:DNA replication protein DnaC
VSAADRTLREESVRQHCRLLRLPTVAAQFGRLAEEAMKQQYGPVRYLEALLAAELEERERSAIARRIFEAKLPRVKTLEEFDFSQRRISRRHGFVSWPKAAISRKRNRWYSLASPVPGKRIWRPGCA